MKNRNNEKIEKMIIFLLIYIILLFFSGYYFFEYANLIGHCIILGLIISLYLIKKRGVLKKNIYICGVLICNILITHLLTGIQLKSLLLISLILIEGLLISSCVKFESFRDEYIKCMVLISIVSLVGMFLLVKLPGVLNKFPVLTNSSGRSGRFLLFATICDFSGSGSHRNQGIFWEPGAFQVFLCLAYIFQLYKKDDKNRKWILLLFFLSIISTMSTTGIIVAAMLSLIAISMKKNNKKSIIVFGFLGIILVWLIVTEILPKLDGFLKYTLVTKIEQVLSYIPGIQNEAGSRMDSVYYVGKEFFSSPFWGIGQQGYEKIASSIGHSMFTCTPINWVATYGIFYGITYFRGLKKMISGMTHNGFQTFIVFFTICVSISSEALTSNLLFAILVFYGLKKTYVKRNIYNYK